MESENQQDKKKEKDPTLKGVVGIQNMRNTCYSNSTIQLLRACPEWNAYCLTEDFTAINSEESIQKNPIKILLAYQDLLKSLWSAYKPAYVRPLGFINEVKQAVKGTVYEMFGQPIPNDSHEFLVYLLDNFHEALNKKQDIPLKRIVTINNKKEMLKILAENGWNSFLSKNNSEIVKLFFGMLKKTIECSNCKNVSHQWEIFNSLKIPCRGKTFKDWISAECETSYIEDYRCDKCEQFHNATLYTSIWKLPQNLFITLRRFNYDGRKNMETPPNPYGDEQYLDFTEFFSEESDDESKKWKYEMRGISDHHGSHLGGHYTAQFKHPITGEWWWMDDEQSNRLDSPQIDRSNYIYFFKRINQT